MSRETTEKGKNYHLTWKDQRENPLWNFLNSTISSNFSSCNSYVKTYIAISVYPVLYH